MASKGITPLSREPMWSLPPVVMDRRVRERVESIFEEENRGEVVESMLRLLATPPPLTTVRFNKLKCGEEEAIHSMSSCVSAHYRERGVTAPAVVSVAQLQDTLVIPGVQRVGCVLPADVRIVVGLRCGQAVLRGADVFAPGVLAMPRGVASGSEVAVYADVDGKCRRGLVSGYEGKVLFVGNGRACQTRHEIFSSSSPSGLAVKMTQPLYVFPSLNLELPDGIFLQNMPSIVASHVLNPRPGELVLDLCAAPGGKTTHIATLMNNEGCVVAVDKSRRKIAQLRKNTEKFSLSSVHSFVHDATKSVDDSLINTPLNKEAPGSPPYPPGCFDRVMVDAPCSGLGQRPQIKYPLSASEFLSYPPLQRKILKQAVAHVRLGGTLVYSTCSLSPEENERQVAWLLDTFPQLSLVEQHPVFGYPGLPGFGLDEIQCQKLQRFGPPALYQELTIGTRSSRVNVPSTDCLTSVDVGNQARPCEVDDLSVRDTVGFFIAKFAKT